MQAELITIGTELLLGEVVDTNAAFLARQVAACGLDLYYISTVGDNLKRGRLLLAKALERSHVILISGGLGPTSDDVTRAIVSATTGLELVKNAQAEKEIKAWYFARYGAQYAVPENNKRQAFFPRGAQPLWNSVGSAPGFLLEVGSRLIIALPGVPWELEAMFKESVQSRLSSLGGSHVLVSRNLNFAGIGESELEDRLQDLLARQSNPTLAIYASQGALRLRLTAKAYSKEEGLGLIAPWEELIRAELPEYLYGQDDETLEEAVGKRLRARGLKVAVAESCTGGLIGHRLTNVAGSSHYFLRGYVVYSNKAKEEDLKVPTGLLNKFGAVSPEIAKAMAEGVRSRSRADLGLAVTGIAGPGGGSAEKPVGLVYISLASEGKTIVKRHNFLGQRQQIKQRASQAALHLLWGASG